MPARTRHTTNIRKACAEMRINMSYRENAAIISTACLADGVYEMWLKTEKIAKEARPGQFISVYSNDGSRLLPRPISICRIDDDKLRIVYRRKGNKGVLTAYSWGHCRYIGTSRQRLHEVG